MSWDSNPYYKPEALGLRTIGEAEFSSGSYEFDTTVVWQDIETGRFYYADDSGCSCPVPFEDVDRSNIEPIERLQDLIDHLEKRKAESYYYRDDKSGIDGVCADLIQKYRDAKAGVR